MYYVYLIRSLSHPEKVYAGYTVNLKQRLQDHNYGESIYTADFRPWELVLYIAFQDKGKALAFEKYLKSHAGRAFAEKRLL